MPLFHFSNLSSGAREGSAPFTPLPSLALAPEPEGTLVVPASVDDGALSQSVDLEPQFSRQHGIICALRPGVKTWVTVVNLKHVHVKYRTITSAFWNRIDVNGKVGKFVASAFMTLLINFV